MSVAKKKVNDREDMENVNDYINREDMEDKAYEMSVCLSALSQRFSGLSHSFFGWGHLDKSKVCLQFCTLRAMRALQVLLLVFRRTGA